MLKGAASAVARLFDEQRVVNISSRCLSFLGDKGDVSCGSGNTRSKKGDFATS